MKRLLSFLVWLGELALLCGLLSRHMQLYDMQLSILLLLLSPALIFAHWTVLAKRDIDSSSRNRLFFLTGPCIFLALFLVVALTRQARIIEALGGPTKEMGQLAIDVPQECVKKWTADYGQKMISERNAYTMILISMCLLYNSRLKRPESRSLGYTEP
ncbi:hypothetical protein CA54_39450 [Symmachiella macrocystis]|uniref:Uncharacterized protein n=1 Tax=Symmachiella macrocystis TaxID=2527985 RepID=A0A5C6B9S0_9PLAN|nr:hypothetical protein [Symmachiella macrocystis]TWU08708.1 hypothetical protein CA54_39450 [Symmachiella macrocystis]